MSANLPTDADLEGLDEDTRRKIVARFHLIARKARQDPLTFLQYVGRVEGGAAIRVPEMHKEWYRTVDKHPQVVLMAPVGSAKTSALTRWRVLWEIGKNPNIRIAIVSATEKLPKDVISGLKQDIEGLGPGSEWLRLIFPHLARRHWKVWADDRISVTRADALNNPTVTACSPGKQILGSRFDLIICDDLHNIQNTLTQDARDKMFKWVTGEVFSRDAPSGTRFWVIGHVWDKDDVLHRLIDTGRWYHRKYGAFTIDPETGVEVSAIPEVWSTEQLKAREANLGPVMSKLMLRNELVDSGSGRIKREYFQECLVRGQGLGLKFPTYHNPNDSPTFTGVDLGFGGGSLTCMFTATVYPDGSRQILEIRSGDWSGPDIVNQLKDVYLRFGSIIYVESNGAQRMIDEFATELTTLPITRHITGGGNKHNIQFGIESIAIELCNKKWVIPCDEDMRMNEEVANWITECIAYDPKQHLGDRLSASWICREAIRKSGAGLGAVPDSFWDIDSLAR